MVSASLFRVRVKDAFALKLHFPYPLDADEDDIVFAPASGTLKVTLATPPRLPPHWAPKPCPEEHLPTGVEHAPSGVTREVRERVDQLSESLSRLGEAIPLPRAVVSSSDDGNLLDGDGHSSAVALGSNASISESSASSECTRVRVRGSFPTNGWIGPQPSEGSGDAGEGMAAEGAIKLADGTASLLN